MATVEPWPAVPFRAANTRTAALPSSTPQTHRRVAYALFVRDGTILVKTYLDGGI